MTAAARMEYAYDNIDFTYPDAQAKMDARTADGWVRADSSLMHPYLLILWERPWSAAHKAPAKSHHAEKPEPVEPVSGSLASHQGQPYRD